MDERDRDLALLVVFAVGFFSLLGMAYYASSPLTILLGTPAIAAFGFGVVYQVWRIRRKNQ